MNSTVNLVLKNIKDGSINKNVGIDILKSINHETKKKEVAIVGIALNFPHANTTAEYWCNLINGVDCTSDFSKNRIEDIKNYTSYFTQIPFEKLNYLYGGYLDNIADFDYNFFNISLSEAKLMDPSHRLFLQKVIESLKDAKISKNDVMGKNVSVYLGYSNNPIYGQVISRSDPSLHAATVAGNTPSIAAGRVSHFLDLHGINMVIDTACSSSLVAAHMAFKAVQNEECEMAIAGGVRLSILPIDSGVKVGIESSTTKTSAFDDSSDGTIWGEGVAAVVLMPLEKAIEKNLNIYAVIKGSAVNQDGKSIGLTAPNMLAQSQVIESAWKDAKINPETISYIETHGTGTKLGDPIEIGAIKNAFSKYTNKKQFCAIGSVKNNIGHLDSASGLANLIKACLSLKNKKISPTINFNRPNKNIDFIDSPVYVNVEPKSWETAEVPRRCGVSSFGFSGTNCHMILEEVTVDSRDFSKKSDFGNFKNQKCWYDPNSKQREHLVQIENSEYTDLEFKIAKIFAKTLGISKVSLDSDFFTLGGNSLLTVKLILEIEKLGFNTEKFNIYEFKTIREISNYFSHNNIESKNISSTVHSEDEKIHSKNDCVIDNIEPFNEFFYKNCFYNSFFPVLRHFNKNLLQILANDMIYYDINSKERLSLIAKYTGIKSDEEMISDIGIRVIASESKDNLIASIQSAIKRACPVIIWVDYYYLRNRSDTYQKEHGSHTLLIFGFNSSKKMFNVIEHSNRNSMNYSKIYINYDDVEKAYKSYINRFSSEQKYSYFEFSADKQTFSSNVAEAITSSYKTNFNNFKTSMQNFKKFVCETKKLFLDGEDLKPKSQIVLSSLNSIINAKNVEKYKILNAFGENTVVHDIISEIVKNFSFVRNTLLKFIYTGVHNLSQFNKACLKLESICDLEYELYEKMIQR